MRVRFFILSCFATSIFTCVMYSCIDSSAKIADRSEDPFVEDLISNMSIEEKVGQMTQVTIDLILKDDSETEIDESKLREAIVEWKVGSILNVKGGAYDLETWHKIQNAIQNVALSETPHSIPILYGIDAIHGMSYTKSSVLFPHNSGIGATRNLSLAKQAAKITALQSRASGIRWNFDPMLGVSRNPLWSRFEESYGEDPFLAGELGAAVIKGYEEDGLDQISGVASCAKHYIGYSNPASGKDRTPAYIPDRQLRQFYLPPFEKAIAAGASTVMVNSGEINGIPTHANAHLLQDVLRGELGFEGVIVTDWEDIVRLHTRDRIASTPKEAVRIGIEAGIDLSMVPYDYFFAEHLIELVKEGTIPESRLDDSVRRILTLKKKLGLFSNAYVESEAVENAFKDSYFETALEAARQSITLLKNERNILPLSKKAKVLVAGPAANSVTALHSSWSYNWQGDGLSRYPETTKSILEGIQALLGTDQVINFPNELPSERTSSAGVNNEDVVVSNSANSFNHPNNFDLEKLKKSAKGVDAIILCLGEKAYAESPGIINNLTLDQNQLDLANAAVATGKPVIVVLIQGRPRVISSIEEKIPGIIMAYRPSTMGAQAIAETLFGDNNPSGRLPFSYPRHTNDLLTYDHKYSEKFTEKTPGNIQIDGYNPQWDFGHGLSYTTFDFNNLSLSSPTVKENETLQVSIDVTNTGPMDGHVSIELYCRDLYASITPPVKQLKGFEKISLAKGETKIVSFSVDPKNLFFIDHALNKVVEPGEFEIYIGTEKATFTLETKGDKLIL